MALTTAPRARWMTPFSGPIQRSCESLTRWRQVLPQFSTRDSRVRPLIRSARWAIAVQTISLPRPIVKVWLSLE
jgi:hypothetical protein